MRRQTLDEIRGHLISHDFLRGIKERKMVEVVIVNAARTPVGNFGGSLRTIPAYELVELRA